MIISAIGLLSCLCSTFAVLYIALMSDSICRICADFSAPSASNLRVHYRKQHSDAFRANLGPGDQHYEKPNARLPYCNLCSIYIGHGQYSHSENIFHRDALVVRDRALADAAAMKADDDDDDDWGDDGDDSAGRGSGSHDGSGSEGQDNES